MTPILSETVSVSFLKKGNKTLGPDRNSQVVTSTMTLAEIAEYIRTSKALKSRTEELRAQLASGGRGPGSAYDEGKESLPAIMPASCAPGGTLVKNLPTRFLSGLYGYDIDKFVDPKNRPAIKQALIDSPGAVMVGDSTSGDLWVVYAGPTAQSVDEYLQHWRAILGRMPAGAIAANGKESKNRNRLRYLAHDPECWLAKEFVPLVLPAAAPDSRKRTPKSTSRGKNNKSAAYSAAGGGANWRPTPDEWLIKCPELRTASTQLEGPCPACGGQDRFHVTLAPPYLFGCRQCPEHDPLRPARAAFPGLFARGSTRDGHGGGVWYRIGEFIGENLRATWRYDDDPAGSFWSRYEDGVWSPLTSRDRRMLGSISARRYHLAAEMFDAGFPEGAAALVKDHDWNREKHSNSDMWDGLHNACLGKIPDPKEHHVAVANGCVDLVTGVMHDHSPECGQRGKAAGAYRPEDAVMLADTFHAYFDKVFVREDQRKYLELVGLCMTGDASAHRGLAMIKGCSRSGKGGAVRLQERSLGSRAVGLSSDWFNRKIQDIDNETANLIIHRPDSIASSEIGFDSLQHRRKVCAVAGGEDTISARRPHGVTVSGPVYGLFWTSCVQLPHFEAGEGMDERLVVLRTLKKLKPRERSKAAGRNPILLDAVITGGIMAIRAAGFFDDDGAGYIAPGGPDDAATSEDLKKMDPLAPWLEELSDEWHGRRVEDAREQAMGDLSLEISQTSFGNCIGKSERWGKSRGAVNNVQAVRLKLINTPTCGVAESETVSTATPATEDEPPPVNSEATDLDFGAPAPPHCRVAESESAFQVSTLGKDDI